MNAAEQLVSQARHGQFGALLPELLEMAKRPGGPRDQAWEAAAAAIQTLFWQDRFAEAADLAEAIIAQDGPLGGELCDQDVPFRHAFLAAELHAGVPAGPRLLTAAEHIPAGRNLREDLLWLAEQVPGQPPADRPRSGEGELMTQRSALEQLMGHAFQKENGALEPDERLIPLQFFVTGGSYDFDNLSVKDAAVAMQIRGPVAQKIHNAPEGATIRFGTE